MTGKNQPNKFRVPETRVESISVMGSMEPTGVEYTHDQLHNALLYAEDCLERSGIPFVLFGDTAECIKKPHGAQILRGDKVHIGVRSCELTPGRISTLKSLVKDIAIFKRQINLTDPKGVPIQIDVTFNNYRFMNNPEQHMYCLSAFWTPNPYSEYLEVKDSLV